MASLFILPSGEDKSSGVLILFVSYPPFTNPFVFTYNYFTLTFNERFSPDDEDDDGPGLDEQMQYMIQALEGLPSLRELPGDLLTSLLDMLPAGLFSKELQDRVKSEAKRRGM